MAESMKVISLDPGALEGIQMVRDAARDCGEMQTAIMRYLEEVAFTGQAKRAMFEVADRWCYLMAREIRILETFGDAALEEAQRAFEAENRRAEEVRVKPEQP
ncbi:hypothetical protein ACFUJR_38885 [Streptomyces sp. NPDC057271]|uniref:hypothetical protein n=1 Tax=unclassified Streptomyces TaxID=2593676 RepID=UPI0036273AAC